MGKGHPTSRPTSYVTGLEVLLEAKNAEIAKLQAQIDAVRAACKFTKYPPYHVIDVDKDKLENAIKGDG